MSTTPFGKKSNKLVTLQDSENVPSEVESKDLVREETARRNTFVPKVDFGDPKNFAHHASAEKYYADTITHIYNTYPYDGSDAEQVEWHNNASFVDNYLFENGYPRSTGYITLNTAHTVVTSSINPSSSGETFNSASSPQFVTLKGGPHSASSDAATGILSDLFGDSKTNIYKTSENRSSNLDISSDLGNTVEFWYKVSSTSSFKEQSTCIFDMWNQEDLDSDSYGRLMVEVLGPWSGDGTAFPTTGSFTVSCRSGSYGASRVHVGSGSAMPSGWSLADWHHYAFTFKSDTTTGTTKIKFYVDGGLVTETSDSTTAISSSIDRGWQASVGAYLEGPSVASTSSLSEGYGTYPTASYDELRFWRKARTEKEIKRNWFKQARGGANTDDANVELGVYYKFNEGIINTSSIDTSDATVLDYSGRISNGDIKNYNLTVRSSSSALTNEHKDPIIRPTNYRVVDYKSAMESKGNTYDLGNHTSIMNSIPKWITDVDEDNGSTVLKNLIQIVSSYFDTLQLQIKALPHLKNSEYNTLQSGSAPYHFMREAVASMGMINPDIFIEATVLEEISSRNETTKYTENIQDIKNVIYQNIYNNLPYIYKSKGTEKSFRNLIRCFGIDDEILKVNMYADNVDFTFNEDNSRVTSYKKQYVNFNNTSSYSAVVYQYADASNTDSTGSLKGQTSNLDYVPYTLQCEAYFPKKYSDDVSETVSTNFTQTSIFGLHGADDGANLTWPTDDAGNFQVYFVREDSNEKGGHFKLEFSGSTDVVLTSSIIKNVYDNEKWNLAVRLTPTGALPDISAGSDDATSYQLEFYGVNSVSNVTQNEFSLTANITNTVAKKVLNKSKRIYVGAHRTNFTGSILYKSDLNISSTRFWFDYLDNETIKYHSHDASAHGRIEPYKPAHFTISSLSGSKGGVSIPQIETLVLNWNFQNLSSSNSSGEFTVLDYSSGSTTPYSWFGDYKSKHHTAKGYGFPASYDKTIVHKYIESRKTSQPETLNNSDMVNILTQDDEFFTRDTVPVKHYFSIEKSMYQVISDEMIKIFAGLRYFNDLIGHPVNRYRMEYKDLRKLRQLFFNNVDNTPSLEKYVDFYKWIDTSVGSMIEELFPASANHSSGVRTVIESHMLERNKYWNKFPTIEQKDKEPNGALTGPFGSPPYSWKFGHSPATGFDGVTNTLYGNQRILRTDPRVSSGDANVDADRETIRKAILRNTKGSSQLVGSTEQGTRLYDPTTQAVYEASTYVSRHLKLYNFDVVVQNSIKGGTNRHINKIPPFEFLRTATEFKTSAAVRTDSAVVNNNSQDNAELFTKFKADSNSINNNAASGSVNPSKGSLLNPFSEHSETVTGTPKITNNLFDSYGKDGETPAQSPFTNAHVGGSQHRHTDMNRGETLDTAATRAELYVDVDSSETISELRHPNHSSSDVPSARLFRDELAKRPINIRNIKYSTSSFNIGNYSKDYQVVNTNGRSSQNRWFYKNNGEIAITGSISSTAVIGVKDFSLPDRSTDSLGNNFGTSDHVIVQRFSAPGGPDSMSRRSLDGESEEYSPYNSINYRNLLVRQFLNTKHKTHAGQRGYVQGTTTGSYHKVQRNTGHRISLTGSTDSHIEQKAQHDNFFVNYQIPRSEYQYAWITASAQQPVFPGTTNPFNRLGFSSKYLNVQSSASFSLSGSLYAGTGVMDIDYAGMNTVIYDPHSIKRDITGYPNEKYFDTLEHKNYAHQFLADTSITNVDKAKQLNALLLHRNGPYQYPMWKQLRTGETPLARSLRKENLVVVYTDNRTPNIDGSEAIQREVRRFKEPVVTWNIPIETHIKTSESDSEVYKVKNSYRNNLEMFANPHLSNFVNPEKNRKDKKLQPYDKLLELYDDNDNPIVFKSIRYSENIFPKHRNVGLNRTRSRMNYEESEDTLRKSPGVIRTFWRSDQNDRIKPNRSSNALDTKFSISQIDHFKQLDSFWALDHFYVDIGSNTYEVLGDLAYVGIKRYRSWITGEFLSHEASPYTSVATSGDFNSAGVYSSRGQTSGIITGDSYQSVDYLDVDVSSTTGYKYPSDEQVSRNTQFNNNPDAATYAASSFSDEGDSVDPILQQVMGAFRGYKTGEAPNSLDEPGTNGGILILNPPINNDFMVDNGYTLSQNSGLDGYLPGPAFELITDVDGLWDVTQNPGSTNIATNIFQSTSTTSVPSTLIRPNTTTLPPRPAIQFYHQPFHSILGESAMKWRVSELSGKKPWYNIYRDYGEDIQRMGQNYSTIPEFRISKHMPYYVQNERGNFTADNYGFLTLEGSGDHIAEHDSAEKRIKFKKVYSRDGIGADDISAYPTGSGDINTNNIQNNAWYGYIHPDGDLTNTTFKNYNNVYSAGTFDIDNSIMTVYNITKTLPSTEQNSSGVDWKSISPYQTRNAAVNLNTEAKTDYLISTIEKINTLGSSSISLQQESSGGNPGTPLCVSFWASLDDRANDDIYVGAWNVAMGEGPDEWMGLWLKAPKAKDWGGSSTTRGITFFTSVSGEQPATQRLDAEVSYDENIYEFFNADGSEATLTPGTLYHILFEFVPRGMTGGISPAYIRMFLNGSKLYGKHIKYANYDTAKTGIAYSAVPMGADTSWNESETYGDSIGQHGFNKLTDLQIGKSNPDSLKEGQYFYGLMDEFSMWYGTLTSDDATRMNYYGQPSNLTEEYANTEIAGSTGSWNAEFGSAAPKIGSDAGVTYTVPTSSFSFKDLELFQWSRLGVPLSVKPDALQVDYSEEFFNKYCHTDFIKYFDKITEEHAVGTKTKLRLKISAVKKLLPYNGFYPSQRTTQMAYLFKESYKDSITLKNANAPYNKEGLHKTQAFQALLQPFFAPGLLYNTIKSGIAVDWPIFTNTKGFEPSRPFPIMDAFTNENEYIAKKVNIAAPSWYVEQDLNNSGMVGDVGVAYDPGAIELAAESFGNSQPKYNIGPEYGTDAEGFVIINEPSARLDFDKLLDVESAFYNEDGLGHKVSNPTEKNINIFPNVVIEFRGFECEENSIILRQPIIENQEVVGFEDKTIRIINNSDLDVSEIIREKTETGVTIYMDFLETQEIEVSELLAKEVIDYINKNNKLHFIAVGPGMMGPENSTEAAFRTIEKDISSPNELGPLADFYRIRIVYTGPLSLTVQDKLDHDGVGDLEIIYNQLITDDPSLEQLGTQANDVRDLPLPKFYYVRLGSQVIRTESLFTSHNKSLRSNGFGDQARISLEDSAVPKQNGVTGILGVRYVNEAGSTSSDSDSSNYTPMIQSLRYLYGGRNFSAANIDDTTSLGSIKLKKKPNQVFLMAPTYYTGSVDNEEWYRNTRFPYFEWNGRASNPLYKMAMHNFLAETPKFFLKKRGMTTLASSPQNKFKKMQVGKKYFMDVVMYSEGVHMTYSPYDGQVFTQYPGSGEDSKKGERSVIGRTQGRYYGFPYKYMDNEHYTDSGQLVQDPAYCPNTPPYFYGRTVARIVYTADRESPTIDDIHRDMKINYVDGEILQKFIMAAKKSDVYNPARLTMDVEKYGIKNSPAYKARMKLEASINFKAKTRLKNVSYDVEDSTLQKFNPVAASDSNSPDDDVWVITPKFECPVLNFDPASTNNATSFDYKDLEDGNDHNKGTSGTGLWHGYGQIPADNKGIFLSLEESFKFSFGGDLYLDENEEEVGSLISSCGFKTEISKIGELADERKVSEAIVMIPFVDSVQKGKADTISIINKNFFKINKGKYDYQKSNIEKGNPAVLAGDFGSTENIQETSISRMAKLMGKYNIPPKFDFETYNRDPFVMYMFEFNHTFDQQDLSDIWQGVLPKIGTQARYSDNEDDNEIIHDLGPHDFFEGQGMPSNVRWLVFKIKQKGEKNFYNITADSRDDSRFKFDFQVGNRAPEYSYNWPYDYFSLVELVNIEGGVIIEPDEDE